jgi:hypothetical protein
MEKTLRLKKLGFDVLYTVEETEMKYFVAFAKVNGSTIHSRNKDTEAQAVTNLRTRISGFIKKQKIADKEREKIKMWEAGIPTVGFQTKEKK